MFDLNEEILKWRNSLAQSEPLDRSDIDELENHLREQIESLTSGNLPEEECFWLARRRLGGAGDLAGEFAKVNRSTVLRNRLFWMAAGVLTYTLAMQSGVAASKLSVLFAGLGGLRGPKLGFVAVASEMLALGLILYLSYRVYRRLCDNPGFSGWTNGMTRRIILLATLAVSFVVLALAATQMVGAVAAARLMRVQEYGRVAIGLAYAHLALDVLLPVVMVVMMIVLRKSRSNEIGA